MRKLWPLASDDCSIRVEAARYRIDRGEFDGNDVRIAAVGHLGLAMSVRFEKRWNATLEQLIIDTSFVTVDEA